MGLAGDIFRLGFIACIVTEEWGAIEYNGLLLFQVYLFNWCYDYQVA